MKAVTTGSIEGRRTDGRGRAVRGARGARLAPVALVALLALAIASSASAASYQRPFKEVFGTVEQPTFINPQVLAVDPNTGDVLVADSSTKAMTRFHADGTPAPFSALGSNKIDGARGAGGRTRAECDVEPESCDETPQNGLEFRSASAAGGAAQQQIAIDGSSGPTKGDIYVAQSRTGRPGQGLVDIFSSEGRYLGQLTATELGPLTEPCGLAVDPTGALYVAVGSIGSGAQHEIAKYVPGGNPVTNVDNLANFPVKNAFTCNMAAGVGQSTGWLFAAISNENSSIKVNETTGEVTEFVNGLGGGLAAMDPTSGNPILGRNQAGIDEFDGSLAEATARLSRLVPKKAVTGLAVNASGEAYVLVGASEPYVSVYGLPAVVATVTGDQPTNVTGTRATLHGTVNPAGLEVTECLIEWGPTATYGNVEPCEGLPAGVSDSQDHAVHVRISGLTPNGATYHFRVSATDAHGTESSSDRTFTTAQTVVTNQATEVATGSATLSGTLRPEGTPYTSCEFEWEVSSRVGLEQRAPCEPTAEELEAGFTAQPVRATLTGLQPDTSYRFRVTTDRGTGDIEEFTTLGAPRISEVRALNATQNTALLEAKVNPNGIPTTYRFEWGPTASYGNQVPVELEPSLGKGTGPVLVMASLTGLSSGATYHYRVVATSEAGSTVSSDQEVETLNACGFPDQRCLELVSPRGLNLAAAPGRFLAGIEIHNQASEEPGSFAYVIEGGLPEATKGGEVLYRSSRSAGAGWSSSLLSPPTTVRNEQLGTVAAPSEFFGLSPDLSCGVVGSPQPLTDDPVAELMDKAGGANLYLRSAAGNYGLITDIPPEELKRQTNGLSQEFTLAGMSPDCSTVVFSTMNHYSSVGGVGTTRLYEWREGSGLHYLGWVPGATGEQVAEATAGAGNVVSEDGSRVFFMADRAVAGNPGEVGTQGVFVRQGGTVTHDLSASQTATPDTGATYRGATPDGSRVYFTANAGLTTSSSEGGTTDLYEYDFDKPDGTRLSDLSATPEPGGANVKAVVGIASDGSHVYFTSPAQLVPGRGKTLAQNIVGGSLSLYDRDEEATHFVATVEGNTEFDGLPPVAGAGGEATRVSPTGRYLLFESGGDVTGYEGGDVKQAYLYDADSPVEPTVCVSCRQDGASSLNPPGTALPPLAPVVGGNPLYKPQTLVVKDGKPEVFFSSRDRLAPGAAAGFANLYEWAHGQVFLLVAQSVGVNEQSEQKEAAKTPIFGGASADGGDLYFFDPAALNWENPEGRFATWDARVGGGFPAPAPGSRACDPDSEEGGSCHGPEAPAPLAPAAGTVGFNGLGNVTAKPKKGKKKHQAKRRRHHKRRQGKGKPGKQARHANRDRGAGK
ncbi:MAG TPA: hypothetical protein VHE08_06415 [Solirubrobacterales bacterium]|nr:hypothetical protein [Solirubrobacterales bacterium]